MRLPRRRAERAAAAESEADLVERLRARDESAFTTLVERHHASLVRLAMSFVPSRAVAEEVAQETWLGVLNGIDRFEGRSSLKTWIFRILVNRAKTRGERESRSVPLSSFDGRGEDGPAVDPDRFFDEHAAAPGAWSSPPRPWDAQPEERLLSAEVRMVIAEAIDRLPPAQRRVIALRDVEGLDAEETRELLELTEVNQRVLLHRARSKVRQALESYMEGRA